MTEKLTPPSSDESKTLSDVDDVSASAGETDSFAARVQMLVDMCGGIMELARRSALSHQVIRKYMRGISDPSRERLVALARAASVELNWLATGQGSAVHREVAPFPHEMKGEKGGDHLVSIPLIDPNNTLSRKHEFLRLDPAWLAASFRTGASALGVFLMRGDSMAPTILADSPVIIDRSAAGREPIDGVFLCRLDGQITVKRLQWLPGRRLRIMSDNAIYETYEITLSQDAVFSICGRVLFSLHRS
ncbi:MAG: helix-turn-helix domain-containing protein [Alphaproteobacteria bacterium]|nr:helix-turn-helix domain-containing protein [Alphaproteobacteria bacterium]MBU0798945.1 helix-turn-helix domain-containing protein [Alphaproteobacteria bacterium]MBU0885682.1 helix-turn-helix domain-containing protein [Alphaproteobacteria bacterium]MBU1812662.1 helix-turn-helix domain-containing protein [Alphaproteobacteria bacterium]MBU2089192.1 helix-turn-helix domain-containing protein [Alphaproteobacteria bacterium]